MVPLFEFLSGGSIEVKTDKGSYALGESVNAEFVMKLSKNLKARGLYARLCAYEMRSRTTGTGRNRRTHSERVNLCTQDAKLGGEKEYSGTTAYKAVFKIPNDPNLLSKPGFLGFIGGRRIDWEITAKLDIAMAFDVSGKKGLGVHA